MAVYWGPWTQGSGYSRTRIGIEFFLSSTATQTTARAVVWFEIQGSISDSSNTLTITGSHRWSGAIPVSVSNGRVKVADITNVFTRQYGSSSAGRTSVTFSGLAVGGTPTVTGTFTVPARAYSSPALPSNPNAIYTATDRATVSWTKVATTAAPVSGFTINRQTWPSSSTGTVATLGGSSTAWTDTSLKPGMRVRYLIRQNGSGGSSSWAYTPWVTTTPLAPTMVQATREGTDIVLTWSQASAVDTLSFEVWEDGKKLADVSGTSYTVVAPEPSAGHTYEVRETSGGLSSPGTFSNTIELLGPPLAPTNLQPNSGFQPAGEPVFSTWEHNPVDGTAQTAFELRYRSDAGAWTTITGKEKTSAELPGTVGRIEWQVRTRGDHAMFSPWSAVATFDNAPRPTATIEAPALTESDNVTITLTGTPAGNYAWRATASIDGQTIAEGSGYGQTPFEWTINNLPNSSTVKIEALLQGTVWSEPATALVRVEYAAPAIPILTAEWNDEAAIVIDIEAPEGNVPTETVRIQRRIDGGTWESLIDGLPVGSAYIDPIPPLNTTIEYRAIAVAGTGAFAESQPATPNGSLVDAHFLNWGDGWARSVRIRNNPERSIQAGLQNVELVTFAGHTKPTMLAGSETTLVQNVTGSFIDEVDVTASEQTLLLLELARSPRLVWLRPIDGDPVLGVVSGVSVDQMLWGEYRVKFTHTEAQ